MCHGRVIVGFVITTSSGRAFDVGTADTLQAAIYSLRGPSDQPEATGGTVWIWGDITLARRVDLISGVCLDFMGHTVTLAPQVYSRRASFAYIGRTASHCTIRRANVVSETLEETPIILVESRGTSYPPLSGILLEDLHIISKIEPTYAGEYTPTGIMLNANNGGGVEGNTFQRLRFRNMKRGLWFNKSNTSRNRIADNFFYDIHFDGFERMVTFTELSDGSGYSRNIFNHVRGRASSFTQVGFENIVGEGNHFDHCSIDNWQETPLLPDDTIPPDWILDSQARQTYICAHTINAVEDRGSSYTVFDPPLPEDNNQQPRLPFFPDKPHITAPGRTATGGLFRSWGTYQ